MTDTYCICQWILPWYDGIITECMCLLCFQTDTMSWNAYLDNLQAQSKDGGGTFHCDKACIIGIDGGAKWTTDDHALVRQICTVLTWMVPSKQQYGKIEMLFVYVLYIMVACTVVGGLNGESRKCCNTDSLFCLSRRYDRWAFCGLFVQQWCQFSGNSWNLPDFLLFFIAMPPDSGIKKNREKSASLCNNFSFDCCWSHLGHPHARRACDWQTLVPLRELETTVTTVLRVNF